MNYCLIGIYKYFQTITLEELINLIDSRIQEFNLTRYNYEGFDLYKKKYNTDENYCTPLDLFVLSRFSFNNLITIKDNKYTGSFGFNRSDFNLAQRSNLNHFYKNIQKINFSSLNFINFDLNNFSSNDFLYVDPPYLISADL